jgi:hypothetical protein
MVHPEGFLLRGLRLQPDPWGVCVTHVGILRRGGGEDGFKGGRNVTR